MRSDNTDICNPRVFSVYCDISIDSWLIWQFYKNNPLEMADNLNKRPAKGILKNSSSFDQQDPHKNDK